MDDSGSPVPFVFTNWITVKDAACHSGYNIQYLRRILRCGVLDGIKIGQMWLIDKTMFEGYMQNAHQTSDKRFGPK
jgi:hypothetical protein